MEPFGKSRWTVNDDFDKTLINPNLALNLTQSSTNQ